MYVYHINAIYFNWSTEVWENILYNSSKVSVSGTNLFKCYGLALSIKATAFTVLKYLVIYMLCNICSHLL